MDKRPYLLVFLIAATISFLLTHVIRRVSVKLKLLDIPDERKIHTYAVPYLGGVSVFFGFMMAIGVALHLDKGFRFEFLQEFIGLFVGSSIILLLGIFDDLGGSSAGIKLSFQAIAATVLWGYGFRIETISSPIGGIIELGPILGWFITIFWFCSITNAMNLIDGLDGLCSGIGAIAATTLFIAGIWRGENVLPFLAVALCGSLLGFLPHNFHPAKIFLGDTGSLMIGFLIAAMSLFSYTKASAMISLLVAVTALALPVADTLMAILRRSRLKKHLFQADRGHIHHRLIKLMPYRTAVFFLYVITAYASVLGLSMVLSDTGTSILILATLIGSIILIMVVLRMIEIQKIKEIDK
ncbi:MAG: undecaprenyl-phosphate alpha-N-acetylglucosaminyl 1-phosphate transferase [Candidatus Hydrogenedentes bacterium CG07_land_8_20_14_0_80_42_17]|nr:MAG: undecaprenyl-phosphate alpha-N-acetylglucosaminyl 1-phosphate transferase [Candidatus Hydrogenedentes bacterium CG07_land_8_20_14_0_80_42_17]